MRLIIPNPEFVKALRVLACGTDLGGFLPLMDIATHLADPGHFRVFAKYLIVFHIVGQRKKPFLMVLFHLCDIAECSGDDGKALFVCNFSKFRVQVMPFFMFSLGGGD